MKHIQNLLAFPLLFALCITSCSDPVQEVSETAALQAKLIDNTAMYYAQIPGNNRDVYAAEVIEYTDGSAQVTRSIVPYNGNQNFVHSAVSDNVPITQSSQGVEIDLSSGDGWFVPFDPSVEAIRVGGRVVGVDCECDNGASGCNVDIVYSPSTGKADIGCLANQNCTGNCRATLIIDHDFILAGGGILINAGDITTP